MISAGIHNNTNKHINIAVSRNEEAKQLKSCIDKMILDISAKIRKVTGAATDFHCFVFQKIKNAGKSSVPWD